MLHLRGAMQCQVGRRWRKTAARPFATKLFWRATSFTCYLNAGSQVLAATLASE